MASIQKRPNGKWRARYRDPDGKEHARHFRFKTRSKEAEAAGELTAQEWLDQETAKLVTGTWVAPKTAKTTVDEWCHAWMDGYSSRRPRTVLQARSHIGHITKQFGTRQLSSIRPSEIKAWVAKLKTDGLADSTIYAIHSRFRQILADAVHDGLIPRSPISRRTAPKTGTQRPYVATTAQVWALYDAMPEGLRPVVLLAAFAGLRLREIAALRVEDVDFMRGIITPTIQYPDDPLKTEMSRTPIPIPQSLTLELNKIPTAWASTTLVVSAIGRPATPTMIDKAFRAAREAVEGLPEGFRLHDLRHYYASLLIAAGLDVKVVQARLRHTSAKTTLDVYGHLWPDRDESARAAIEAVFSARADSLRTRAATSQ